MYSKKQIVLFVIVTAVVFFCLGYLLASPSTITTNKTTNNNDSYQAGWDAAKQRLIDTGFYPMANNNMEIKFLSGEVQQIADNTINLKIRPLTPLDRPELDNRIVNIDNNTKIYRLETKDESEYQKEMAEFNATMQRQRENPESNQAIVTPPDPLTKVAVSLSEIKEGMQINVEAAEDIKNLKEFDAAVITIESIKVMSREVMPAATMPVPEEAAGEVLE